MTEENPAPIEANPLLESANPAPQSNTPANAPVIENAPANVTADWRQDWREALAAGDNKELERLSRFTAVPEIYKSFRNLETKLSSGKYKPELSANPTPEELTAYRKAVGVPDKPEGYFEKLGDGLIIGEEDKATYELFANKLHELNAQPEVFKGVVETALALIEQNQSEMVAAQVEIKEASRHQLYQEWGPAEYKMNINAISNLLTGMPETLKARFEGATLADGTLMFNDAEAMKWWAQHVRENNPAMAVMPAGTGDAISAVEARLEENRQMMRTPSEWFSKANEARRTEHAKLLQAQMDTKRRA